MVETRTIHDPFHGKDVEISNGLIDRLRGKYACGPTLPNGEPKFGWRRMETSPISHEAADRIEALEAVRKAAYDYFMCAVQDEADDLECCVSDNQHELAKTLRDALRAVGGSRDG